MIAYVDASVLLRVALRQPDALPEWRRIERGVSSALIMTESLRTLDRLRLRRTVDAIHLATALLWKEESRAGLTMATHDRALGLAAQAHGLAVVGVPPQG